MLKIIITTICTFAILVSGLISYAKIENNPKSSKLDLSQYPKVGDITLPNAIELPTVFRLDKNISTGNTQDGLVVVDQNGNKAQEFTRFGNVNDKPIEITVKALSPTKQFDGFLNDGEPNTFTEFDLDKDIGKATIEFDFGETRYLEGIQITLAENIKKPESIEILGQNLNDNFTVIAKTDYNTFLSYFPPIKVSKITINLFHSQILRISEIYPELGWGIKKEDAQSEWFFLAIPGNTYRAFVLENNKFPRDWQTLDLNLGYEIKDAAVTNLRSNEGFEKLDSDGDGIRNLIDNCPKVANQNQEDKDQNKLGDVCEDRDLDGVVDGSDNCPLIANPDQVDLDGDKSGNDCDGFDNRFLETNTWVVPTVVILCSIVVVAVFATRIKKMGN